jgi:hypothetical protein
MSLFNSADIKVLDDVEKVESAAIKFSADEYRSAIGKVYDNVEDVIGEIIPGQIVEFTSAGEWSTHELLFYILSKTGPAKVYIATWSMGEYAARWLLKMLEDGMITELYGVLDFRTKNRHPDAYQLAKNILAKMRLTSLHAKVTVIENENWSIVINGSANYTNNPRIESGLIIPLRASAEHHKKWIIELLEGGKAFE